MDKPFDTEMNLTENCLNVLLTDTDNPYLKLKGYSIYNKVKTSEKDRYDEAKKPFGKVRTFINTIDADKWTKETDGWIGVIIRDGFSIVDIDNNESGELVFKRLKASGVKLLTIKTPRGYQFTFRDSNRIKTQDSKLLTLSGIVCDYKLSGKGYIVLPSKNTPGREFIHCDDDFDVMPLMFLPVRKYNPEKDNGVMPLPIYEGSRDETLFRHACRIREWNKLHRLGLTHEDILNSIHEINEIFCEPPLTGGDVWRKLESAERYETEEQTFSIDDEEVTKDTEVTFDYDKNIIPEADFPFNVFKDDLLQIIDLASRAIHIEPKITASVLLAIVSGAIGNTVRISPKQGYTVPLFIWLIVIALSGYGKSPLMKLLMRHIKELQSKEYIAYEKNLREYDKASRDAKNDNTLSIPEMPRIRHYEVSDNTVEALTTIFKQDPRGTISNQDEIASLIQGLNQYKGKGNDREHYLTTFNCESIKVDRKGKTTLAQNTGLSIIGGIQPKKMPAIFESDSFDDGLIARFLTINGKDNSIEFSREFVTDEAIKYWIGLIDYCYSIPLEIDENGFVKYKTLILSEDALNEYISFYNDYGRKMLFLTERAKVFIPKLTAYYCLKFAGILHVLNSYHKKNPSYSIPQLVDVETMTHATALTKYFAGQAIETVRLYDKKESLNEFQQVLVQVLYDLRGEVKGGKILLSRVVNEYNSRIPSDMTPRAVSAILRDLGLTTEKMGQNLSNLIWELAKIEKLFHRIKVTKVTKVTIEQAENSKKVTKLTKVTVNPEKQNSVPPDDRVHCSDSLGVSQTDDTNCAEGPRACGHPYKMMFHSPDIGLAPFCKMKNQWCWTTEQYQNTSANAGEFTK